MTELVERFKGYQRLSAGSLKCIAILTMLIDHFMAGVFAPLYRNGYFINHNITEA